MAGMCTAALCAIPREMLPGQRAFPRRVVHSTAQHRDLSFQEPSTAAQQRRDTLTLHTTARLSAPQGLGKEVAGAAVVSPSKQEA